MLRLEEWYRERSVLVTGGSGFIGKVLLEKMLRSLPGLKTIYILLRSKRGISPEQRLETMIQLPIFDQMRNENPKVFQKLRIVVGDLLQPGLGISAEDRKILLKEVAIVFHCAASLRLESELKQAVLHNTTGTYMIIQLCQEMVQLEAFVYVSSVFCHCEEKVVEERTYAPHVNPHNVMHLVEWLEDASLRAITPQLLGHHPNCYMFTKKLAEGLIDEQKDKLPVIVLRPSIVIPSLKEPLPGWVDSLNGPMGVMVGAGKGVIRSMLCRKYYCAEVVPVDILVNSIIVSAWYSQNFKDDLLPLPVFNISTGKIVRVTWAEIFEMTKQVVFENPFEYMLWYPGGKIRTNRTIHNMCVFFTQILPAYLIDFLLLLAQQKRFMVRLQKRICVGLEMLQYFTMRPWEFDNKEALNMGKKLTQSERDTFYMDNVEYDIKEYIKTTVFGARLYCMKEQPSSIPRSRRNLKVLYILDWLTKLGIFVLIVYLLYHIAYCVKSSVGSDWIYSSKDFPL